RLRALGGSVAWFSLALLLAIIVVDQIWNSAEHFTGALAGALRSGGSLVQLLGAILLVGGPIIIDRAFASYQTDAWQLTANIRYGNTRRAYLANGRRILLGSAVLLIGLYGVAAAGYIVCSGDH